MDKRVTPIPVMFTYKAGGGPWCLGYIHPDDLKKINPVAGECNVEVYEMYDGIPYLPDMVVPLEEFKAPDWNPSWNWDVYCENRKKK